MADAGIGGGVAVMVVTVPPAFIEQELEAAVAVEIVVLDQLVLGEAVDHHEQYELWRRLPAWCARVLRGGGRQ
jgi:hypothetical protein